MKVLVVDHLGRSLGEHDMDPKCGELFCDCCGDCAHCYGDETCYGNGDPGEHSFTWYLDDEAETSAFLASVRKERS